MAEPALLANRWLDGIHWAHYTGGGGRSEGVDAALGHGPSGNQATFTILVDWEYFLEAVVKLCGEYFWSPGGAWMTRVLPKQHPAIPWLYVSRLVSCKPMVFVSKDTGLQPGNWSNYRYVMITVAFEQPKYPLMTDAALDKKYPVVTVAGTDLRQEWRRFMEWTPKIGTEVVSIEAKSFTYSEGTGGATQPTAGTTTFNSPWQQPIEKGPIIGLWKRVPVYGLISPTTYRATWLDAAVGTVNKSAFPDANGYPAGTLLLQGYDIQYNEAPYTPARFLPGLDGANQGVNQFIQSTTADVSLHWLFYDPPHSHSAKRGHNLAPFRKDPDGSWYKVTVDGVDASASIVPEYDHQLIFQRAT